MQMPVNIHGTDGGSVTEELPATRRYLIALRVKFGSTSAVGRRCSNIVQQIQNLQDAANKDERQLLKEAIGKQMAELKQLTDSAFM